MGTVASKQHYKVMQGALETCLSAPGGSRPRVMKSSASAPNSRFTICRVARISPLQHSEIE